MSHDLFAVEESESGEEAIVLRLHVQPGAGRAAVVGRHGDALRVKVAPPPLDGRANVAVLALVAELCDVPVARVELVSGERSRAKRVRVSALAAHDATRLIDAALERAARAPGGRAPRGHRR